MRDPGGAQLGARKSVGCIRPDDFTGRSVHGQCQLTVVRENEPAVRILSDNLLYDNPA